MSGADENFSLRYSQVESERFNRRIFRAKFGTINAALLADAMRREQVDTVIARVPPQALREVANLHACGLLPIVADAYVNYDIRLADFVPGQAATAIALQPADDRDRLRDMARTIFQDYPGHYRANPLFDESVIADGYADWAVRLSQDAGTAVDFITAGGATAGFVAYRSNPGEHTAEFLLAGVVPQMRGNGVYLQMFSDMLGRFKTDGFRTAQTATQAHNVASQRTWTKLGIALRSAEYTLHINRA